MPEDDPLVTLEIFGTLTEAQWAQSWLDARRLPSVLQDVRTAGMFSPNTVGGIKVQVRRSRAQEAREILAAHPFAARPASEKESAVRESARCAACGSDDLAAVPARESRTGTYTLRCLECGEAFPADAGAYFDEDIPLLPAECPECGGFRLHNVEPPAELPDPPPGRQWVRCDDCAHEWEAPLEDKLPGGARPRPAAGQAGTAAADPEAPPVTCPKCGSAQVMEWTRRDDEPGWARLRCLECEHAWLEGEDGAQRPLPGHEHPPADEPEAWGPACPSCGGREVEATDPPPYAAESALGAFFKHFVGRGWHRCLGCGHVWEV